jgi:putative transposase
MIAYIDAHRGEVGVELICRVLRAAAIPGFLTSRGYRVARTRPPSTGDPRRAADADLVTVNRENYSVYGVKKMHQAMKRKGWKVGREQTRRLMKKAGLRGVQRGKPVFTTITDPAAARPADLVNRRFCTEAPNRLWVADITFVRTWQGFATPRWSPMPARRRSSAGGLGHDAHRGPSAAGVESCCVAVGIESF